VKDGVTPLLSLKSSQQLELIQIVDSDPIHTIKDQPVNRFTVTDPILQEYLDVFEDLGCLAGDYKI
jgi:hypothetical protein